MKQYRSLTGSTSRHQNNIPINVQILEVKKEHLKNFQNDRKNKHSLYRPTSTDSFGSILRPTAPSSRGTGFSHRIKSSAVFNNRCQRSSEGLYDSVTSHRLRNDGDHPICNQYRSVNRQFPLGVLN